MEIKDLKDIVINCKTEEEAQECCNLADKLGLKWGGGEPYTGGTLWKTYRADMCYDFLAGDCCSCSYAATHNFAIQSSKWFLKNYTIKETVERKIGEEFYLNGVKVVTVESVKGTCEDCILQGHHCFSNYPIIGSCSSNRRKDNKTVIFVEKPIEVKKDTLEYSINLSEKIEEPECKTLKIAIPEGYEIDKDQSSFEKIIFKKIKDIKVFNDLIGLQVPLSSIYIDDSGELLHVDDDLEFDSTCENIFKDELLAKSSLAMSQISQLLPYYGGAITEEEWEDDSFFKYNIERYKNTVYLDGHSTMYTFLAFHTEEQRDSFYENNKQLVNDYLMISNND